mgnify:FL=1|jgi:thiamine biosynthesis protein ThiI
MENMILIKYGELTTKKDNRKQFINILYNNLNEKIKKYDAKIIKEHARMYIICNEHTNEILDVVSNTFGIHAFNICYKTHTNTEDIKSLTLELLKQKNFKTFKVETKRRDKNFPIKSMDFNHVIGSHILKNINDIKVEVENPEILVHIEINKEDTYIYFNDIKGLGGYPVGVQQKGLLMLSGGIDSPVAGYLALKRGIKIDAIYFEAIPHTSLNAREKVKTLAKELLKYTTDINLYVVPITKLQEEIYKNCDSTYIITILRRMMYRISEQLANKNEQLVLINGESIGQVASQTLNSMRVINEVVKIPVIRPVACLDKLEIIEIAKKINTYETSILPYEDCCTIFVPRHPVINPKHEKCLKEEQKINYEQLIKESIENTMIINIKDEEQFSDIL